MFSTTICKPAPPVRSRTAGIMVEYYTDMLRTYNEAGYRSGSRDISDRCFANLWGAGVPHRFPEHLQPLAEAHPARA